MPTTPVPADSPAAPELTRLSAALSGQYRVERELGRGGMGVVLLARDLRLDRLVAIKTLPIHLAGDAIIRERFLREARTAAGLSHPHIVPIHHADEVDGEAYFVMGFVDGISLAQFAREVGRLAPRELVPILADVADALGYAHRHGVVHRDIKAENILIDSASGRAMVTDFGIARMAEAAPMTATGNILGTVHYMSPEQVNGEHLDGRSDLYALGVLAFMLLAGRFPFDNEVPSAVLVAHVLKEPPSLRSVAPDVPAPLAAIIDKLLRKDPAERFATAEELAKALRKIDLSIKPAPQPSKPQVLSSADANAVWERAAALQDRTGPASAPRIPAPPLPARSQQNELRTAGYKMSDVIAAAEEVGIERKYVDRAIAERVPAAGAGQASRAVATSPSPTGIVREGTTMNTKPSFWLGARTKHEFECTVEGEVDPGDYDELVTEMSRAFGEFGTATSLGRTVTLTASVSSGPARRARQLQVSVTSRRGFTTIRAFEDMGQVAVGIVGGVTGGVGGGVGGATLGAIMSATQNPAIALPAMLAVVVSAFGIARLGVSRWSKRRGRHLSEGVQRLAVVVEEMTHRGGAPRGDA